MLARGAQLLGSEIYVKAEVRNHVIRDYNTNPEYAIRWHLNNSNSNPLSLQSWCNLFRSKNRARLFQIDPDDIKYVGEILGQVIHTFLRLSLTYIFGFAQHLSISFCPAALLLPRVMSLPVFMQETSFLLKKVTFYDAFRLSFVFLITLSIRVLVAKLRKYKFFLATILLKKMKIKRQNSKKFSRHLSTSTLTPF